jgi:hypothetical protein
VKPDVKAVVGYYYQATSISAEGGPCRKVLVKDRHGLWQPRSGYSGWGHVHDAVRRFAYKEANPTSDPEKMPKGWTSACLLVTTTAPSLRCCFNIYVFYFI